MRESLFINLKMKNRLKREYKWGVENENLKLDKKKQRYVRINEYKWWKGLYRNERKMGQD